MEILKNINWLDIIILFLILRGVFLGVRAGLTSEVFKFIGTVLSLTLSIHWHRQVADILIANLALPDWLSYFLCFVTIAQLVRLIFKYGLVLLVKILHIQFAPPLERPGGGMVGLARGIFLAGILVLALGFFPSYYMTESIYDRSFSGAFLVEAMQRTYKSLTFWLPEENTEVSIFTAPIQKTNQKKKAKKVIPTQGIYPFR